MDGLFRVSRDVRRRGAAALALAAGSFLFAHPASAHHAMGGTLPSNAWQGLLSGLAHPVLGLDHLAFVIAAGLLAAFHRRGASIPLAFVAASFAGTGLHLLALNLPAPELVISLSVLLFGALLVARRRENLLGVVGLAAFAGVFHGYAYGESIVGAESTPLGAYLLGLAAVQLAIALGAKKLGEAALRLKPETAAWTLRWAGVVVCGVGLAFLGAHVLG